MDRFTRFRPWLLTIALGAALWTSCTDRQRKVVKSDETGEGTSKWAAELARVASEAPSWVSIYDPQRAWNGLTLDFFERSIPILIDMNGVIVHSWPQARVRARLRLLPNGNLLAIGLGAGIVEYDWQGNKVWEYEIEGGYAHHDLVRLENGNTLLIMARKGQATDDVLEVSPDGQIVWEWRSAEFLAGHFGDLEEDARDITHINSIQALPPNPWFDTGDQRFRPGNILLSARNLDKVFLIDRETLEVIWSHGTELDRQHEALMIEKGYPGHGNILIFNNGLQGKYLDRQSAVLELNPIKNEVVWEYRSEDFYSPIVGVQQLLPNGNVLIASSLGPRTFEVSREGEIVWQWTPPFKTKRPWRYPNDFTPQLVALGRRPETPVVPEPGYRHIDRLTYRYARASERRKVQIDARPRTVMREPSSCRQFLLPAGARVQLTFGVDRYAPSLSGWSDFHATFVARLRPRDGSRELRLLQATIDAGSKAWKGIHWNLDDLAFEKVELCLESPTILAAGEPMDSSGAYWGVPRISGISDRALRKDRDEEDPLDDLTPEEIEVRRKHLETLGYID